MSELLGEEPRGEEVAHGIEADQLTRRVEARGVEIEQLVPVVLVAPAQREERDEDQGDDDRGSRTVCRGTPVAHLLTATLTWRLPTSSETITSSSPLAVAMSAVPPRANESTSPVSGSRTITIGCACASQ